MLKSNGKQAIENIYKYIRENTADYILTEYTDFLQENGIQPQEIETKKGLYQTIYKIFKAEKWVGFNRRYPEQKVFQDWGSGLAMGGLFDYYYNTDPAEIVAELLEETPEERANYEKRFTVNEIQDFLTNLIYREITKANRR